MLVTDKGQVTIPKLLRDAAGIAPGSRVEFALEGGRIVVTPVSTGIVDDRRERMKAAGAKAWRTMDPAFQQLGVDDIMEFLRGDGPLPVVKPRTKARPKAASKPSSATGKR